jgi:hypothetical protein
MNTSVARPVNIVFRALSKKMFASPERRRLTGNECDSTKTNMANFKYEMKH